MGIRVFRKTLFLLFCFSFFLVQTSSSKEVDQFSDRLVQIQELENGQIEINEKMNSILRKILKKLNKEKKLTKKKFEKIVHEGFQGKFLAEFLTPMEYWVKDDSGVSKYWPYRRGIYGHDVDYDDMWLAWYVEVAPVIRLGRFLVGVDKIGHFLGQGWYYYREYRKLSQPKRNLNQHQILEKVREYGHHLEMNHLGSSASGVYSYGDLAANWQGFQFFLNLIPGGKNPYFKKVHGRYIQIRKFRFLDYVTDDWDEIINPVRVHSARFHKKIVRNIRRAGACREFRGNRKMFLNMTGKRLPRSLYVWRGAHSMHRYSLDIRQICRN